MANKTTDLALDKENLVGVGTNMALAFGGMALGAIAVPGRVSFPGGIGMMLAGLHFNKPWLIHSGMGLALSMPMAAAAGGDPQFRTAADPDQSTLDKMKEEVPKNAKMFFQEFGKKLFIDKIPFLNRKDDDPTKAGGAQEIPMKGLGAFAELERLNQALVQSAMDFNQASPELPVHTMEFAGDGDVDLDEIEEGGEGQFSGVEMNDF